jgi:hypothetical protein
MHKLLYFRSIGRMRHSRKKRWAYPHRTPIQITGMKSLILTLVILVSAASAIAQQDPPGLPDTVNNARIYVIRSTGFTGSAVNMRVWVDSTVYCKIKNNRYAVIYVAPGSHSFYANTWDASKPKEKLALKMEVEAGKTYYLSMRIKEGFFGNDMFVEEITTNTATPMLQKYKAVDKCN